MHLFAGILPRKIYSVVAPSWDGNAPQPISSMRKYCIKMDFWNI